MPLKVEGARQVSSGRRSRGLADIAPQYVAKSGLCTESELEGARGTSFRIQHVLGASSVGVEGASRFPKLDECAHFHYEHVDLGRIQISLVEEDIVKPLLADRESVKHWYMRVNSHDETWMIRRSYDNFRLLDEQLHRCIYDRKFSALSLLPLEAQNDVEDILSKYLEQLSSIAGSVINCGPVLNWLEMDNRGHRLLVPDTDTCPINTPAVAAAYTVKKYQAQAPDELSFEVGDMISVIDMPPPEESIWWRGKRGFLVGFFPCECVSVIGDKVPRHIRLNSSASEPSKSVLRKHGKLIAFFRSFILSRPSRRRLKQSGILKERVFGCDLGEHLQNSGHEIPLVLKCCAEFIEAHGIVDGIYRLSGVTSNIHKLRNAFDEDRVPALYDDEAIRQDIHSVASLLKMYFRELPNPLCTYQLYHQFVNVVQGSHSEDLRLLKMREVIHKLPPPHYRTLEYLMLHLSRVAERGADTGMTPRNVAIVWAPNLLRCREFEVGGVAALQFVGVQAVVTEFLVRYVQLIFTDKLASISFPNQPGLAKKSRPKSLAISTPTKLLSLEEARNRALLNQQSDQQEYIEVGGGPASLPPRYHTVIELPRKRAGSKRSPLGWRMLFGSRGSKGVNNHQRKSSTPSDFGLMREKAVTEADLQSNSSKRRLRPAKSVESLNSAGESPGMVSPPRVPQATLRPPDVANGNHNNHNRSVSHDSYFDTLQDDADDQVFDSTLDISEIQVNFDLEESEMRIFSEDETVGGSGSIGFGSPRPKKLSKSLPMAKRLTAARLARGEDSLSSSQSADPSPKKQKTQEEPEGRSRLEERLSASVGELQFIDSVSPDQIWVEAEVHPIQSPSPISSLSRMSSLLPPTSPILPHIPHLNQSRYSMPETPPPIHKVNQYRYSMPESPPQSRKPQYSEHSTPISHSDLSTPDQSQPSLPETPLLDRSGFTTPGTPHQMVVSDSQSTLTTPDTPLCSMYTALIESPDPPKPEERRPRPHHPYENVGSLVKPVLETSFDVFETFEKASKTHLSPAEETSIKTEFFEIENDINQEATVDESITNLHAGFNQDDSLGTAASEACKKCEIHHNQIIETDFEAHKNVDNNRGSLIIENEGKSNRNSYGSNVDTTASNRNSVGSVKYELISTESSCDSLIEFRKNEDMRIRDSMAQEMLEEENILKEEENVDNNCFETEFSNCSEVHQLVIEEKMEVENFESNVVHDLIDDGGQEEISVAKIDVVDEKCTLGSSDECLSGVAVMFEILNTSQDLAQSCDEQLNKVEVVDEEIVQSVRIGDFSAIDSFVEVEKSQEINRDGDGSFDLTEADQSVPSELRVADTSASSEASDWTTVIYKDQSDCALETESLSEDTSISSGDSDKMRDIPTCEIEKENLPLESDRIQCSPRKNVIKAGQTINHRPKDIKKPPRKDLAKKGAEKEEKAKSYLTDMERKSNQEVNIVVLERSPKFRSGRREFGDERMDVEPEKTDSLVQRAAEGDGLRDRRSSLEDTDMSDSSRKNRISSIVKNKTDIPEVLRVTTRLTDRSAITRGRYSAPIDVSRDRKYQVDSQIRTKQGGRFSAPAESPKRSKERAKLETATPQSKPEVSSATTAQVLSTDTAEWETETPLRSNSSGNVRQLLHKFESCDKTERPRTLERLSTRRSRDPEFDLSDPERRERIEKYKEKRRLYLREKYPTEVETVRRLPPFEKPPRKHPPASTGSAPSSASSVRRSFEAPTMSSLSRTGGRRSAPSPTSSNSPTSPEKHRSLDFPLELSPSAASERKITSPRKKPSSPGKSSSPTYCIKDMAAMFEKRDANSSQVATPHKQYLSSV